MKFRNIILGTMLTIAVVCGSVAAFPAAYSAVAFTNDLTRDMHAEIYVKTQNMEYTTDEGEKVQVAISSNSDDSRMLVYSNLYGERQHAILHKDEAGNYEMKDGTFSEVDAKKIAEIASTNQQWREM